MTTARVFQSGNSQAVRLPKQFRLDTDEVEIFRRGNDLILRPKAKTLEAAFHLLAEMPDDFYADGRADPAPEEREYP